MDKWGWAVRGFAAVFIPVGGFFWGWSFYNVETGAAPFDLGLISFYTVMVANLIGFLSTINGPHLRWAWHYRWTVISAHVFVALNYVGGVVIGWHKPGYRTYCLVFTALWALSAGLVGWVAHQWNRTVRTAVSSIN
eukprot:TRINITY_DN114182_c0_g1_i1.p1 TRINITY_DN114182_c0_g1~~TRINITY_DN114182_c0_g1_i1.p1  ORF type:complete len:136 (+),score=5.02 TRINITY_DN114182_c0_g1_i1:22-429(+)